MNFKLGLSEEVTYIDKVIREYLPKKEGYQSLIFETISYNLDAGGKRIRPMLMKLTYELFGGSKKELIEPFMAAIEMIHTYSLVHDDLPAMDNDEYRRGRKTTHVVYGEDVAILTGDGLLNLAFEVGSSVFSYALPEELIYIGKALQIMSKKAGIYGMIGGQIIDMKRDAVSNLHEVKTMYQLKTSALMEASMMIGAALNGAGEEDIKRIEKLASLVGLAFQIKDDILDITSSEEVLGKPIHSDEKNEKSTYVSFCGLEQAQKDVEELSKEGLAILESIDGEKEFLRELIINLITREK